jgi:hypothetical protein
VTSQTAVPPTGADPAAHIAALPGVAEAVELARRAVDGLRGHRVMRRSAERVAAESALRGARASAALAGADVPLETLRAALTPAADAGEHEGSAPQVQGETFMITEVDRLPDVDAGVVQGALRVAAEVGLLRTAWPQAPLQVVARLHTLAAAGAVPDESLGRPAPGAATRLGGLGQLLTAPTTAPALVVAAVAHAELATMGAFPVGAGVVGRAAGRLTMIGRGLDPAGVSVPEVGHVELGRDAYLAALDGYRQGGVEGITGWVLHCAEAVVLGAREGVAVCESLQRGG